MVQIKLLFPITTDWDSLLDEILESDADIVCLFPANDKILSHPEIKRLYTYMTNSVNMIILSKVRFKGSVIGQLAGKDDFLYVILSDRCMIGIVSSFALQEIYPHVNNFPISLLRGNFTEATVLPPNFSRVGSTLYKGCRLTTVGETVSILEL